MHLSIVLFCFLILFPVNEFKCSSSDLNTEKAEITSSYRQLIPNAELSDWMLSDKIIQFKNKQDLHKDFKSTKLSKSNYLEIINGQVLVMHKYQDDEGRIIDPVENIEKYYSTPCYAHSVAILAYSNYTNDKDLIESGMKALDISLEDMYKNKVPGGHGDFYTYPVMFAYSLFKEIAASERLQRWEFILKNLEPEKLYKQYLSSHNNWNVVNFTGEFLRFMEGFTTIDYVEDCLAGQIGHFTKNGMYNENGNPLPYDLFPRHYLSGILFAGYNGKHFEKYRDLLFKGAWMSLFMQSPFGELPTGYRSSQHIWNEAEQCVVFELYANAYEQAGKHKEASAFKRAALLSLKSVSNWIRPDGSGYVVKNKFPIEDRHGYETYSAHTCYNLLACSMLAQAWQFSNNEIKELPAPADVGGFVIPLTETFHKIFANVQGTYLEYDTRGGQKYNPTGIIRVQIKGAHPQLGPADGCASLYSGEGNSIATGPAWLDKNGKWTSLAELQPESPLIEIVAETKELTEFKVSYTLGNNMKLLETISIKPGRIQIRDEIIGEIKKMRINWPVLVFNGENETIIKMTDRSVNLDLDLEGMLFSVEKPEKIEIVRSEKKLNHRNGIVEVISFEFKGNSATYAIEIP